jgi:hypothetical protein
LRNDDFSDLEEHYRPRGTTALAYNEDGEVIPEVSTLLVDVIKGMMRSDPTERMTLEELELGSVMRRMKGVGFGAALKEEKEGFLRLILGEV